MSSFIKNPNLPDGKVCNVVCGTDDKRILGFFIENNINVISNEKNPYIDPSISEHADMALIYLGEGIVLIDKNQSLLKIKLAELDLTVIEADNEIKGSYPNDIRLNFTLTGEYAIGNFSFTDSKFLELVSDKKKINVKQGYCKCSTLVVTENAIITDDPSIHRNVLKTGLDSLLISKGDIGLDGHEYGFIGGASGKISSDMIAFFGDITKHRDFERIKIFLQKHGCNYICTDNSRLRDIGGIVQLKEKS